MFGFLLCVVLCYAVLKAVFGYGCSVEEHIKYGLCLDGQCGRRAKWEDVTLLAQDRDRLGHGGGLMGGEKGSEQSSMNMNMNKSKKKKNKDRFSPTEKGETMSGSTTGNSNTTSGRGRKGAPSSASVDMRMSKRAQSSIEELRRMLHPAEDPDFSPLKTASLRGDFDTIVQLCLLGADINERDR